MVAAECRTRPNTVIKWRQRFVKDRMQGLADAPRPGAPKVYSEDFRNRVLATLELHVILDNYCTHKKCDEWLARHRNVHFHFTPTSVSWLNQVEVWFGIMSRKALRGASFKNVAEPRTAIEAFIAAYNPNAKPFKWRKREVKGSQLRNTIVNLCN